MIFGDWTMAIFSVSMIWAEAASSVQLGLPWRVSITVNCSMACSGTAGLSLVISSLLAHEVKNSADSNRIRFNVKLFIFSGFPAVVHPYPLAGINADVILDFLCNKLYVSGYVGFVISRALKIERAGQNNFVAVIRKAHVERKHHACAGAHGKRGEARRRPCFFSEEINEHSRHGGVLVYENADGLVMAQAAQYFPRRFFA